MNFVSIFLSCMPAMPTIRNPEAAFLCTTSTPTGTGIQASKLPKVIQLSADISAAPAVTACTGITDKDWINRSATDAREETFTLVG